MTPDAQVAIIGGGPVGTGLAIELGQRGITCIVVERYQTPSPIPRGQNLTQRTMEHFWFWGIEQALRAARTIPPEYGIGGLTAYGTLLSGYQYDWLQRELVRPFYFTDNERLPQYATERVLRQRVSELPTVTTLYGWAADDVRQDDEGVSIDASEREGNGRRMVRAEYVVGCDGSRSLVRKLAGIAETRSDHDRLMVLLVFRSNGLHKLLERFPGKSFFNVLHPDLEGYWQFFGRVDLGSTWFFHAPVPFGTTKDNFDFRALLQRAVGADFDVDLQHIGFWDLRFAVADTYRKGRMFIAGDAAHSHPPYGGYGINTGFEDARNLGWKIAATFQGWGGAKLLDSYSDERQPVFASTAKDFIEKSILEDKAFLDRFNPSRDREGFERAWAERQYGAKSEVNAFEPHYEGSPIVWGPAGSTCNARGPHSFRARSGHHLTPQPLSSGKNVFDELGGGFALIAIDADETAQQSFEESALTLGIPMKTIRDSRSAGRERYEASLILVRPDQFVAWAGEPGVTAPTILAQAVGK